MANIFEIGRGIAKMLGGSSLKTLSAPNNYSSYNIKKILSENATSDTVNHVFDQINNKESGSLLSKVASVAGDSVREILLMTPPGQLINSAPDPVKEVLQIPMKMIASIRGAILPKSLNDLLKPLDINPLLTKISKDEDIEKQTKQVALKQLQNSTSLKRDDDSCELAGTSPAVVDADPNSIS